MKDTLAETTGASPQEAQDANGPTGGGAGQEHHSAAEQVVLIVERFALVILLLVLVAVFSIVRSSTFPTTENFQIQLASQAIPMVVALGLIIPLVATRFDVSLGATVGLTSVIAAQLMAHSGMALLPAILVVMAIGAAIGSVNGFLVAYVAVDSLVVTLATATVLGGILSWVGNGEIISEGISPDLLDLGVDTFLGIPTLFVITLILAVFVWYLLRRTPFGRYLEAIGSSESSARLAGLPIRRVLFLSFVASGVFASLAGVMQLANQGSSNPSFGGVEILFPALAAVFLGATVFTPGRYNVPGTLVGLLLVAVTVNGLALLGAQPYVQPILNGVAVLIAVSASTILRRRREGET